MRFYTSVANQNPLYMVEVFITNVKTATQAKKLTAMLQQQCPGSKINFDLNDCDKVLRVEGCGFAAEQVAALLHEKGFTCDVMSDMQPPRCH